MMLTPNDAHTVKEAEEVFADAVKALDSDAIQAIRNDPREAESDESTVAYAKKAMRRVIKLRCGAEWDENGHLWYPV